MRIDAYSAISQIYQSNSKVTASGNKVQSSNDKLEISQTAKHYQTAKAAVSETSDIREDKVARIKSEMVAGTYSVSSEAFAEKILNNSRVLSF